MVVPCYTKLDFSTFDSSEDLLIWLYCCEKFFTYQYSPEEDEVELTALHMFGEAQVWYHQLESEQRTIKWAGFKEYCLLSFEPPARSNPFGVLVNLKQTRSVEEYQRQFQEKLARANRFV